MEEVNLNELRKIQLKILDVTARFCEEHNIKYWLDSGTLLGAVRHKGYIPWDDDIDLGMLRPDYEKFMKLFSKYTEGGGGYKFVCYELDNNFYVPSGKVIDTDTILYEPDERGIKIAVYIDIFVYDNAPDDDVIVNKMFRRRDINYICKVARQFRIFQYPKGNLLRRLSVYALRTAVRIFPLRYFVRNMLENSKRYADADTKRVGNFLGVARMVCSKDVFDDFIDGEFEGKKYKIPAGYDKWLRAFYGDYMQLPPVEKRVSTHVFKAYRK